MRQFFIEHKDSILGVLAIGVLFLAMCMDEPIVEPQETETEQVTIQWSQETEETESGVTVDDIETVIVTEPSEPKLISLGEFFLTAYCPCTSCSGQWGTQTSTGTTTIEGRTVAVDPTVIPYGTVLIINGHEYIAEDCGGSVKGNHIDIYFESHDVAKEFGEQYAEVYILEE